MPNEKIKTYILLCEECRNILSWKDIPPDGKWGHICRAKKYKQEHRCESYTEQYVKVKKCQMKPLDFK